MMSFLENTNRANDTKSRVAGVRNINRVFIVFES